MPDLRSTLERVTELLQRKERFAYDLRGNCQVHEGLVAAYRSSESAEHFSSLPEALAHAAANEGIIRAWKDPVTGSVLFDSCRLFTDRLNAARFAQAERQRSIYDLNRNEEIGVATEAKVL